MRYWSTGPLANRDATAQMQHKIASGNQSGRMLKWRVAQQESPRVRAFVFGPVLKVFTPRFSNGS